MSLRQTIIGLCICVVGSSSTFSHANDATSAVIEEANLLALSFIDIDRGWVAGERGVILHTQDGGLNWKSQATPSKTCLVDIAMYNSQRGLAVGGATEPYTGISVGEVVITKDGGQSWTLVVGHDLPRLRKMVIGLGGKCIAVGDWSPVHLSSVFTSSDGGATWQPAACDIVGSICDIAGNVDDYLILSDQGEVVRFRQDTAPQILFAATNPDQSGASPGIDIWQDVTARDDRRILAGPQGMIVSDNYGETWKAIPRNEHDFGFVDVTERFSIELWQDETWMTKDTSSVIALHQSNANQFVEHHGGSSVRSMLRLDRDRGWAVGDFGMILATRDGGHTWRTLRGGNRSPAVMVVGSQPVAMPWSILATESLQHQRRVAMTFDQVPAHEIRKVREQLIEATALLGPATVYGTTSDGSQIADVLRTAKPAVLILDLSLAPDRRAAWSAAALESGCKRVIEVSSRGSQTINVSTAIPAAGILASDVWLDAVSQLSPGFLPPTRLMLNTRYDSTGKTLAADGLASCTHHSAQYCWSRASIPSRRQLQVLQARTAEMNWVESLIAPSTGIAEFRSQLAMMLPRMNDEDRTRLFAKLLSLCSQRGRSDLHIALLETIEIQWMDLGESSHDAPSLARVAKLRLEAIRSSIEWRRSLGSAVISNGNSLSAVSPARSSLNVDLAVRLSPFQSPRVSNRDSVATVGAFNVVGSNSSFASRDVQLASGTTGDGSRPQPKKTASVDLRWEFHPAVLMVNRTKEQHKNVLLAMTEPTALGSQSSYKNLQRLAGLPTAGRWGLLANDLVSPKTIFCPIAGTPPHLDGTLDESWWRSGHSFHVDEGTASLQLAHDDAFVYVGIDAPALAPTKVLPKERTRDTALDSSDRYRIRLDLDRDLMTAYEFEFDQSGNTRDRCDGFSEFNPRWFIACAEKDGRTRVEIAIQKSDIAVDVASHQSVWNVSLDRFDQANPNPGLSMPESREWMPVYLE